MRDTKNYIRELKRTLPDIKERLIAVLVLLAMSVTMMVSATFAWVVLSTKPEVEGITMSISGNGNLEIALRNTNNVPGFSQIGDSVAAGTAIKDANITWGNLINLAEGYGLDSLVLRPARLNMGGLPHGRPLEGVIYGEDGRVEGMQSDYAFTVWQEGLSGGSFKTPTDTNTGYGVRAISSMTYTYEGESALLLKKYQEEATTFNGNARTIHAATTAKDGPYIDTIVKLMGDYMTWNINSEDYPNPEDKDCSNYIVPLVWLIRDMLSGLEQHGMALVKLVNAWQFNAGQTTMMTYEQLQAGTFPTGFNASGYSGYAAFKADYDLYKNTYTKLNSCLTYLTNTYGEIAERQDNMQPWKIDGAYWAQIDNEVVNVIVKVATCQVENAKGDTRYAVSSIGMDEALNYISGTSKAYIYDGLLVDYERLTGEEMFVPKVSVRVSGLPLIGSASVTANVMTKWADPKFSGSGDPDLFTNTQNAMYAYLQENMSVKDAVAGDTFGLVLDLWARTNAPGSILGLNGTIVTRKETREVKEVIEGVTYQMYSLELPAEGEEEPVTLTLYKKGDTWYNFEDHKAVNVGTQTPIPMVEEKDVVIEYNGDNRVWEEDQLFINEGARSTTQGSGSCYIYYADSPEAGMKSLELLKNLKIAFISGDNKYLATASMDTEHVLQQNGKYTVPLVITESSCSYLDEDGNQVKGIMYMPQNQAVMISAIVYLDGEELKNEHVLAASDIQGNFSIQFKSSALMEPIADRDLMEEEIKVSATLGTGQKELSYEYRYPFNQEVAVNLTVEGFTPESAEAFFQRQISETQGSRMASFPIDLATGKGIATFTSPGSYILRYVRLDGVEYELEEPLRVYVSGFAVDSVQVGQNYFMTADQNVTTSVSVNFGALEADKLPRTVQARFMTEAGSAINVKLLPNPNGAWVGDVTFSESGVYRLEYLVLDGQYTELSENLVQVVEARLGMSTEVIIRRYLDVENNVTTTDLQYTYEGQRTNFKAYVKIKDDSGTYLTNLDTGVAGALKLFYKTTGSVGTISADLKWDADYGGYATESEGFFVDAPGTYRFAQVTVNGNSITNAYPAPVISAMYPDPPTWAPEQAYDSNEQEIFAPNSDASVTVHITNAGTEKVWLVFEDASGKLYEMQVNDPSTDIDEVLDGDGNRIAHSYTTKLPLGADGTQAGTWKLVAVKMADVNDGKGGVATADNPYVLNLRSEEQLQFTVTADDFTLVFNEEGNEAQQVIELADGIFMSEQKLSNLYAWLIQTGSDGDNHYAVTGSTVKLTYSYVRSEGNTDYMYEYGGYTTTGNVTVPDVEILLQVNDAQSYKLGQSGAFTVAGKYVLTKAVLTIPGSSGAADKTYTHVVGATEGNNLGIVADTNRAESILPEIHVKSDKPTVKVTAVSPTTSITVNKGDEQNGQCTPMAGVTNSKTDYSATVYIGWSKSYGSIYNASLPEVTLELENISDSFTSADMQFAFSTHTSSTPTNVTFTFTSGNKNSAKSIGYMQAVSARTDKAKSAGKKTVSVITVTATDGTVYTVDLSHAVTINQPQYPYLATVSSATGTSGVTIPADKVPGPITAVPNDDGQFVLTLPATLTWTETTAASEVSGEKTVSGPTRSAYYETWTSGCDTLYQEYTYTVTVKEAEEVLTSTERTYNVTGWRIGDKTYNLGETVIIDQDVTVTAVVEITEGDPVVTTNILTTTITEYYRGKNNQSSPPAGALGVIDDATRIEIDNLISGSGEGTETVEEQTRTPKP
ncbi:MAG: hypothetical protein E7421_03415 [Ruminococcaceae bacterium]|nr:hypothetical protein [Oscillospiraceae bacterium]